VDFLPVSRIGSAGFLSILGGNARRPDLRSHWCGDNQMCGAPHLLQGTDPPECSILIVLTADFRAFNCGAGLRLRINFDALNVEEKKEK